MMSGTFIDKLKQVMSEAITDESGVKLAKLIPQELQHRQVVIDPNSMISLPERGG